MAFGSFDQGGTGSSAPMSEINTTPLVDVMLVLLIIFIVCGLMILGTFLKKDVFTLLAGFGAMAAVLMSKAPFDILE